MMDPGRVALNIFKFQKSNLGAGFGMAGPEQPVDEPTPHNRKQRVSMIWRTLQKLNTPTGLTNYNPYQINDIIDKCITESTPEEKERALYPNTTEN